MNTGIERKVFKKLFASCLQKVLGILGECFAIFIYFFLLSFKMLVSKTYGTWTFYLSANSGPRLKLIFPFYFLLYKKMLRLF